MKIPRRDLLLGSVSIDLPPVSAEELAALKRFIMYSSIVLVPTFSLGVWMLMSNTILGGALALLSGTSMGVLMGSSCNYAKITTPQATALARLMNDGFLPHAGVQFIRDVAALGRELSSSEALQLINQAQIEEKNQQLRKVYEVAEARSIATGKRLN